MDIWVVAAAAGAGYLAQHWKDLARGGRSISESSLGSSNFVKPESSSLTSPLRKLIQRKNLREDASKEREPVSQAAPMAEEASTSGSDGEKMMILGHYEDCNVLSTSCLSPGFLSTDELQGNWEGIGLIGESSGDLLLKPSTGELGSTYGYARNRSILRSRQTNGQFIKPLSSLESCLMAQLYKEHVEMEDYMFSSIPSSSMPTSRPLLGTAGSRMISKASGVSFSAQTRTGENKLHEETYSEENVTVFGVPPLLNVGSMKIPWKKKVKTGKQRGGRLSTFSKTVRGKHPKSQGSSQGALLFCLGISVGIVSSFFSKKWEVDKLNELLKQTENLVQDLQEELEMKDSLTVKELELDVKDYESQDTQDIPYNNEAPHAFSPEQNFDESTEHDRKEFHDQKAEEESLSKIEAELEAELERLEVNMNSSSLEGKLSNVIELDPDFVLDINHGGLRADMFGRQAGSQPYADQDGSTSSTPRSANYAVSPRELSLRLHEVLQSRLEERVEELEAALQNSQRKVQSMEAEHMKRWREFTNSESGSSSFQQSPIAKEQNFADQPVVINLLGEALDVYNESYDGFTKMNESDEEDLPLQVSKSDHQESLHQFDQDLYWIQNGGVNRYMPRHSIAKGDASMAFTDQEGDDHNASSNDIGTSGSENDSGHDEMEKLLIKQILEKTRKGSPVVLNAQKALFSVVEIEH